MIPGAFGILKSRVVDIHAPAIPGRTLGWIRQRGLSRAMIGHLARIAQCRASQRPSAHVFGQPPLLFIVQVRRLSLHHSGGESGVDPFRRHLPDGGRTWGALHRGVAMALGAFALERGDAELSPQPLFLPLDLAPCR